MATVIGKQSQKIDELLADVVVGLQVANGVLYSTTKDGSITMVGSIGEGGGGGGGGGPLIDETYNFTTAAKVWTITHGHNTTRFKVDAFDANGSPMEGDVTFPTPYTVRIDWYYNMTGSVRIQSLF